MEALPAMQRLSRIVSIGECMVELVRGADGRFGLAFGGDTFNTAVYIARTGLPVAYATVLGDDPYSQGIRTLARLEGVGADLMATAPGRMPGLYLIETSGGERTFHYWRERAPARELFELPAGEAAAAAMRQAAAVYFSGVTLSLYSPTGLERFETALGAARAAGARIVMDSNYRTRGWAGDTDRARATFERFWKLSDVALPTFEDEQALWGDAHPDETLARLAALGVPEVLVKNGADGALVLAKGEAVEVPCPAQLTPVDTTAAGDSFNAGYLAARLRNAPPRDAAKLGHKLAAAVIQHRGAIVPKAATEGVLGTKM
jgi:2-dehydro-3-deoxygluconokinase